MEEVDAIQEDASGVLLAPGAARGLKYSICNRLSDAGNVRRRFALSIWQLSDFRILGAPGKSSSGFTLLELMLVVVLIGTLTAIAAPSLYRFADRARVAGAIGDIRTLQIEITGYEADGLGPPLTLAAIGRGEFLDPWGNPYQYFNHTTGPKGNRRKDQFLVPLNSDYDLGSMGKDGKSRPPLTAQASRDDIVRANDGGFIGLASSY